MIMIHQLKIKPNYFEDVVSRKKTFEIRKNDRAFHLGDYLALNELNDNGILTGRSALFRVTYLLDDKDFIKEGYVVLGITACKVTNMGADEKPSILKEGV